MTASSSAATGARPLAAPTPRLNFQAVAPELYKAQAGINALLHESSLGIQLLELVFLRVSQINGCAFCVDMHTRELLSGARTCSASTASSPGPRWISTTGASAPP